MKPLHGIIAVDENFVIGHGLDMPGWGITDDYKLNFVPKTKGCPLIMGANTADSFLKLFGGPLPKRPNIVVSRDPEKRERYKASGFIPVATIEEAVMTANALEGDVIWIIGGAIIFDLFLREYCVEEIHISKVHGSFPGPNEVRFSGIPEEYMIDTTRTLKFKKREPDPEKKDKGNSHDCTVEVWCRNYVATVL